MNLQRNPEIVWRVEKRREADVLAAMERDEDVSEHGTVILIASGMMHQLNYVGGRIWALCDGSRSDEELFALLSGEFNVDAAELAADLHEFINDLTNREWLRRG
jgi:pyrroloquinoline quinone biosynthesis protein D